MPLVSKLPGNFFEVRFPFADIILDFHDRFFSQAILAHRKAKVVSG